MKKALLSLAVLCCFAAAARAQNEVPGIPANRNAGTDENVYAPTRMDRQTGTEVQQQPYEPANQEQAPATSNGRSAASAPDPGSAPERNTNTPAVKPGNGTGGNTNRRERSR